LIVNKKSYSHNERFVLESGKHLSGLEIAYHTYGELNSDRSNVVWICHALTASSDAALWWSTLIGTGKQFDPGKYFIVCANILGSCYGTSGPLSVSAETGKPYYSDFPLITVRDMVGAHILLREHLGIKKINTGVGGSMGGYQLLEWAFMEPSVFDNLVLLTTSAKESAWAIAIHTTQRLAIETDPTWKNSSASAGAMGLKTARAIGMLSYRNYEIFVRTQEDTEHDKTDHFKASSYVHYQGEKLVRRFNAQSYWLLTKAMDSHNLGRGRGGMANALSGISTKTIIIGISSDTLCPLPEQKFLSEHLPHSSFFTIDSPYGHDGFLIEGEKIAALIEKVK
jgi:homoserine O-acetyltransferase